VTPLSVMAVVRTSYAPVEVAFTLAGLLTWLPVADYGLGKDIWSIPFRNITYILHVS
jgi:hypothetical protein